jgi:hypothetical protein
MGIYNDAVNALSPVHYWKLDDASGNFTDSGSGSVALTKTGTITQDLTGGINDSKYASFNASSYASGTISNSIFSDRIFTICGWWKKGTGTSAVDLFGTSRASTANVRVRLSGGNVTASMVNDSGTVATPGAIYTPDSEWHFYALVGNDTTLMFYVDGIQSGARATIGGSLTTNSTFAINDALGGGNDGSFDEIAIFNSALTGSQLRNIYLNRASNYASSMQYKLNSYNPEYLWQGEPADAASPAWYSTGTLTDNTGWSRTTTAPSGNITRVSSTLPTAMPNAYMLSIPYASRYRTTTTVYTSTEATDGDFVAGVWWKMNTGTANTTALTKIFGTTGSVFDITMYSQTHATYPGKVFWTCAGSTASGSKNVDDGNWHFFAIRKVTGNNDYKCYIDGVLDVTITTATAPTAGNLQIGDSTQGSASATGYVDSFFIAKPADVSAANLLSIYEHAFPSATNAGYTAEVMQVSNSVLVDPSISVAVNGLALADPMTASALFVDPALSISQPDASVTADPATASADLVDPNVGVSVILTADILEISQALIIEPSIVTTSAHNELADPMTASAQLQDPTITGDANTTAAAMTASSETPDALHSGVKVPYIINYQLRMNHLDENAPNNNYQIGSTGAASIYRIYDGTPYVNRSLIFKFQNSHPDPGQIIKAITAVTKDSDIGSVDAPHDVDVYRVDAAWDHSTVTWNNQPAKTYLYTIRVSDDGFNYPWPDNVRTLDLTRGLRENIGYGLVLQMSQAETFLSTTSSPIKEYLPRGFGGTPNSYTNAGLIIDPAGNIDTGFITLYSSSFAEADFTASPMEANAEMVDPAISTSAVINVTADVWTATADEFTVVVSTTSNVAIMAPVLDASADMADPFVLADQEINYAADPANADAMLADPAIDTSGNINPMADPANANAESVTPTLSLDTVNTSDILSANATMENETVVTEGNLNFITTTAEASAQSVDVTVSGDAVINVTGQVWTGTGDMFTVVISTTSTVSIVSAVLEASAEMVEPTIAFDEQVIVDVATANADIVNPGIATTLNVNILSEALNISYATIINPDIWFDMTIGADPFYVTDAEFVNPPLITTANNGGYVAEVMTASARQREPLRLTINGVQIPMPLTSAGLWKDLHGGFAIEGLLNDNFEHGFGGGTNVSYLNQPVSMTVFNNQNIRKYTFGPAAGYSTGTSSTYTSSQLESKFVNCFTQYQPMWYLSTVSYGDPTTYVNPIDRTGYVFDGTEFIYLRNSGWSTYDPEIEPKVSTSAQRFAAVDGNPAGPEYYEFGIKTSKLNQILLYGESRNVFGSTTRQAREYGTRNGYLYYRYYPAIDQNIDLYEETVTNIYISDNKFHQLVIQRVGSDGIRHNGQITSQTIRREITTYTDPVTKTVAIGKEIYLDGTLRHRNASWADKVVPRLIMFGAAARQKSELDQTDNSWGYLDLDENRTSEYFEGVLFAFMFRESWNAAFSTTTTSWYDLHAPATPEFIQKAYTYLLSLAIGAQDVPMRASAVLVEPTVSTNAKTILRLFWNVEESVASQNGFATNIPNTNIQTYCVSKQLTSDPSYTYNTDYAYLNNIVNPENASLPATGANWSSGDLDYARFINFSTDISDYANVDIISFIDYPETSDELIGLFPNYDPQYIMHIYDQFLGQLKEAVFTDGKNLFVSSPKLAADLGLVDSIKYIDQDGNNVEPFDNDRINKYNIIGREEDLTSMPSWVIGEVISDENNYKIDFVNKNNGLTIGDTFYIPGLPVRNVQLTTDLAGQRQNRKDTNPIAAFRLEDINYNAQPIAKLSGVDNAITTFIIKPSKRFGQTINGKIFVNTAEDALTLGLTEYNKGVRQIVPSGDISETPDTIGYDWSSKRLKENYEWPTQYFEASAGTGQIAPTFGGGGPIIQAATASSNGNIGVNYYANNPEFISNIYPPFSAEKYPTEIIDVLSMTYRGINWLLKDNVPGIASDALSASAVLVEPTITAQKHATFGATPMYAKALVTKTTEAANPNNVIIRTLPMFADANEIIIGTVIRAVPLTASAIMVNNFDIDFAGGEQVSLILHHQPLITLYLKEEN